MEFTIIDYGFLVLDTVIFQANYSVSVRVLLSSKTLGSNVITSASFVLVTRLDNTTLDMDPLGRITFQIQKTPTPGGVGPSIIS